MTKKLSKRKKTEHKKPVPRPEKHKNRARQPVSDRAFEAKQKAFHAVARMRSNGLSLTAASHEEGTTPASVKKFLGAALYRSKTGKWKAKKSDPYIRTVNLPSPHGHVTVRAHGSAEAELAAAYSAALARWARTGKASELTPFRGKKVGGVQLLTAPRALAALSDAGLLQLDSLYASLKDTA